MTQSTEQERAEFEAHLTEELDAIDFQPDLREWYFSRRDDGNYVQHEPRIRWATWQAARRVQVVPAGWSLPEAAQDALDWLEDDDVNLTHNIRERLRFALSKAPQPPECLKRENPTSNLEAAPVQMPELLRKLRISAKRDGELGRDSARTDEIEHKVRQLLAATALSNNSPHSGLLIPPHSTEL